MDNSVHVEVEIVDFGVVFLDLLHHLFGHFLLVKNLGGLFKVIICFGHVLFRILTCFFLLVSVNDYKVVLAWSCCLIESLVFLVLLFELF